MSNYWDLRCVDCGENAGIDNANREMEAMRALAVGAADLGRAFRAIFEVNVPWELVVRVNGWLVPADFFVRHGDHRVRPVDEYGRFDTPCGVMFRCERCGHDVVCQDREHPGREPHFHYNGYGVYHAESGPTR